MTTHDSSKHKSYCDVSAMHVSHDILAGSSASVSATLVSFSYVLLEASRLRLCSSKWFQFPHRTTCCAIIFFFISAMPITTVFQSSVRRIQVLTHYFAQNCAFLSPRWEIRQLLQERACPWFKNKPAGFKAQVQVQSHILHCASVLKIAGKFLHKE